MSGVNGNVNGNEKGGTLRLDGHKTVFELPTVFADPLARTRSLCRRRRLAPWPPTACR
jgi:uncharacterized protein YhdP